MISDALAGKRLAITGTTGFLGTALVERLLRCVPEVELVLLVRPGRRGTEQRIRREIIRNDVFDRLRDQLGSDDFERLCQKRITGVPGDVGVDGLGLDDAGREADRRLRHRHPLGCRGGVRQPAGHRSGGQPHGAGPPGRNAE